MPKKIRQDQIEMLKEDLISLNNRKLTSSAFTGDAVKTLTLTFANGDTITSSFTDKDTTYQGMTQALLNAGVDTTERTIRADILVEYINSRLSAVFVYAGTVANFADLPTSGQKLGDTWNILNGFQLNGETYPPGSNVAWNGTGWDVLGGFLDTSMFLTHETDPKGVASFEFSGTDTKTLTITLRDGSTVTGQFNDKDTTYAQGTLADLQSGTDPTGKVWGANTLSAFVNSLQITVKHELITITSGMISGNSVNLTPTGTVTDKHRLLYFVNGVKQPVSSYSMSSNVLVTNQTLLPTVIIVGDEVELYYI